MTVELNVILLRVDTATSGLLPLYWSAYRMNPAWSDRRVCGMDIDIPTLKETSLPSCETDNRTGHGMGTVRRQASHSMHMNM